MDHHHKPGQPPDGTGFLAAEEFAGTTTISDDRHRGLDDAIVESINPYRNRLIQRANRLLRNSIIDEADLDAEGTVDLAIFALCELGREGSISERHDALALFKPGLQKVRWLIRNQSKRACAVKRNGATLESRNQQAEATDARTARPVGRYRVEHDLDQIISNDPAVEEVVIVRLDLETFLDHLPKRRHQTVVKMRFEGYSVEEIAERLSLSRRTVERTMRRIGKLYRRFNNNPHSGNRHGHQQNWSHLR
jgi:RNA polymerase sigma factor (sigma-70 family)